MTRHLVESGAAGPAPASAQVAVREVEQSFPLLVISHVSLSIAACALEMNGQTPAVDDFDTATGIPQGRTAGATLRRGARILASHLDIDDQTFRQSVRAAVVLGTAVLLADLLAVDHKFWIVLGALAVLRSSSVITRATGMQAVIGTAVGFVLSAVVVAAAGTHTDWLWIPMVACTFLAVYAPGAVGFGSGQVAFTLWVVFLFTLMQPLGVRTAELRLETVALGVVVAVVGSALLWPRGAKAVVGSALGAYYRHAA